MRPCCNSDFDPTETLDDNGTVAGARFPLPDTRMRTVRRCTLNVGTPQLFLPHHWGAPGLIGIITTAGTPTIAITTIARQTQLGLTASIPFAVVRPLANS